MTDTTTETNNDRREQIVEVATTLFAERGYSLTSLMDIARSLGITGPAIYHWFDRKDLILAEIMERTILRAIAVTESILDDHPDPVDSLARLAEAHVARVVANVERNSVYRSQRVHLPPDAEERIRMHERRYESLLYGVYARGAEDGRLVPFDPKIGIGTFLGGCRWAYRVLGEVPADDLVAATSLIVMRGIVLDPSDPVFDTLPNPAVARS
jgi:AcrR family transcriptional regulator